MCATPLALGYVICVRYALVSSPAGGEPAVVVKPVEFVLRKESAYEYEV